MAGCNDYKYDGMLDKAKSYQGLYTTLADLPQVILEQTHEVALLLVSTWYVSGKA